MSACRSLQPTGEESLGCPAHHRERLLTLEPADVAHDGHGFAACHQTHRCSKAIERFTVVVVAKRV
jgi:hypothetical protein